MKVTKWTDDEGTPFVRFDFQTHGRTGVVVVHARQFVDADLFVRSINHEITKVVQQAELVGDLFNPTPDK